MEARYIPPRRWRDRTPRRYQWPTLTAAVVIAVALGSKTVRHQFMSPSGCRPRDLAVEV